ncbi:MAG: SagB family peptide dehydrogenase [Holophaga sp.]|nr:SagB family peptide dehydrogenase [Holophaga sp.]
MAFGLALVLKPSVRLMEDAGGLEEPGRKRLRLAGAAGADQRAMLRALARGASTEDELCPSLELRYLLALLEQEGWIGCSLTRDGRRLATLEPLTREFRFQPAAGNGPWRLSRFAWIRRGPDGAVLESPLGFARVLLHDPGLLEPVGRLCQPVNADGLSGLDPPMARAFLAMLASAGAVAPCVGEGQLPEDRDPALRQWEFHDLLFHSRSRQGRHGDPVGGTFRFLGELDPLPALKPARAEAIPLPEPRLPASSPPFFRVLEARRSLRTPGQHPVTLGQLGTFLHYVARIRAVAPADPGAGRAYEAASGCCPGGGGLHEIELYLTVSRCAGLAPGFYHYAAGSHALEPWPGSEAAGQLLRGGAEAMGTAPAPDILFTLAARVQRVSWKYQGIAYSLILKNTGVLYQQMYLVATALGLAPCAIGTGDSQLFAQASGLDFTRESSVGEFALSG